MKEHKAYLGKLNGISGIWCDKKPKGLKNVVDITFYTADKGKVFAANNSGILWCCGSGS